MKMEARLELKKSQSGKENDVRALKFNVRRVEAAWLKEGGQEGDWTRGMMSALSLTAWQTGSDIKNLSIRFM